MCRRVHGQRSRRDVKLLVRTTAGKRRRLWHRILPAESLISNGPDVSVNSPSEIGETKGRIVGFEVGAIVEKAILVGPPIRALVGKGVEKEILAGAGSATGEPVTPATEGVLVGCERFTVTGALEGGLVLLVGERVILGEVSRTTGGDVFFFEPDDSDGLDEGSNDGDSVILGFVTTSVGVFFFGLKSEEADGIDEGPNEGESVILGEVLSRTKPSSSSIKNWNSSSPVPPASKPFPAFPLGVGADVNVDSPRRWRRLYEAADTSRGVKTANKPAIKRIA
jgi:hypothetical protein